MRKWVVGDGLGCNYYVFEGIPMVEIWAEPAVVSRFHDDITYLHSVYLDMVIIRPLHAGNPQGYLISGVPITGSPSKVFPPMLRKSTTNSVSLF